MSMETRYNIDGVPMVYAPNQNVSSLEAAWLAQFFQIVVMQCRFHPNYYKSENRYETIISVHEFLSEFLKEHDLLKYFTPWKPPK